MNIYIIITIITIFFILLILYKIHKKNTNKLLSYIPTRGINFPLDETIELPYVEREYNVPKIIYRTHKSEIAIKPYKKVLEHTKNILPNYKTKIFYDEDCKKYIKNNFSSRIFKAYMSINPDYGPAKADLFRYLLIYKEGGIYLDIKSAPKKNLDNIINNLNGRMAISNWTRIPLKYWSHLIGNSYWSQFTKNKCGEYQNWYIISGKGNPLLGKIIKQAVTNIENGVNNRDLYSFGKNSVICMTGPLMMSKVIENYKNKKDFKYFKANINNHLKYNFIDHKKIEKNKHYIKNKNKYVIN